MPFKSKRQQRWMFAAEARGEVPKGTAKRWARETKNIEDLPEKKKKDKRMKKEGMFFEDREEVQDGNFMKMAQIEPPKAKPPKLFPRDPGGKKPPTDPTFPLPPETQEVKPGERIPKPLPLKPPKPAMGTGCKLAYKIAQAMPFGTGVGIGGSPQFGGSGTAQTQMAATQAGAGGMPQMGTGKKVDKKKLKKEGAEGGADLGAKGQAALERWGKVPGALASGTAQTATDVAGKILDAPPHAQAAILGIPAYMLYRRGKKALKAKVAPAAAAGAGGGISRWIRKLVTRGR